MQQYDAVCNRQKTPYCFAFLEEALHQNGGDNGSDADFEDETSSSSSCPTVRSVSPKGCSNNISKDESIISVSTIPRSISGQILESDDEIQESSLTESCSRFGWESSDFDIPTLSTQDIGIISLAESRTTCCSMISLDQSSVLDDEFHEKFNLRSLSNVRSIRYV